MAVDFTPAARLTRSSTGVTPPLTVCGWFRADAPALSGTKTPWYQGTASFSGFLAIGVDGGNVDAVIQGTAAADGPALDAGEWVFLAMTIDGSGNAVIYWRAEGEGALQSDTGSASLGSLSTNHMAWGSGPIDSFAWDGAIAYGRLFTSVLSEAEVLDESASPTAVDGSAWADWPMSDTSTMTADASGNGRTLTVTTSGGGAHGDTAGPSIGLDVEPAEIEADLPVEVALAAVTATDHDAEAELGVEVALAVATATDHDAEAELAVEVSLAAAIEAPAIDETSIAVDFGVDVALAVATEAPAVTPGAIAVGFPVGIEIAAATATGHQAEAGFAVELVLAAELADPAGVPLEPPALTAAGAHDRTLAAAGVHDRTLAAVGAHDRTLAAIGAHP